MKINLSIEFLYRLGEIIRYIAKDKPIAAKKLKKDLILNLRKDLKFPFNYKKSIYFKDDSFRDYVFKGYTISYKISDNDSDVNVIGIIKNKHSY